MLCPRKLCHIFLIILFYCYFLLFQIECNDASVNINENYDTSYCNFVDLSNIMKAILCSVESKVLSIPKESFKYEYVGCLLDNFPKSKGNRCNSIQKIPIEADIKASDKINPPAAKNKHYQNLAMTAEKYVPWEWWREAFAHDGLLLSHNDSELPKKLLDGTQFRNKKLKNILTCATRQPFIRKSFDFYEEEGTAQSKCKDEKTIQIFYEKWIENRESLHGSFTKDSHGFDSWKPLDSFHDKLLLPAFDALDYYFKVFGGIWTGCFGLQKDSFCRQGLAAASFVVALNYLYDIVKKAKVSTPSNLINGYMLASLGRTMLHGDSSTTGDKDIGDWKVKLNDFVALQAAFLKLYIDSFGMEYSRQLDKFIPLAFPPSFQVYTKPVWSDLNISSLEFEPVYTSLRNLMFTESSILIDFGPYRPLVSLANARNKIKTLFKRRVLIDIGANGFFASPKYLLDSYAPYLPFTHAIMVEPEPHFSASIPAAYSKRYNISFLQIYAEVGTNTETDMIKLLPKMVTKDDYVVLKFDVDPNRFAQGPTMEWGFLFILMQTKEIAELIDEVYIELHFHFPQLTWLHYHSNWEALDAIRYLRRNGVIVHAWP